MVMKLVSILVLALIIIFVFFNRSFSLESTLENFPKEFTFYQYSKGEVVEKKIISKKDKEYVDLIKILNSNINGWSYSIATYAPEKYFVSPDITINIKKNIIIINDKKNFLQITKIKANKSL